MAVACVVVDAMKHAAVDLDAHAAHAALVPAPHNSLSLWKVDLYRTADERVLPLARTRRGRVRHYLPGVSALGQLLDEQLPLLVARPIIHTV